ncbi:hypothetical protein J3R82DRAFT_4924 [Butyriboletus roseoflavus]|nr:hypothetical protein J3R82DRAFT_4924 [Butyriboletus roseoflavus]
MNSELTLVGFAPPPTPYYLSSTDLTDAVIYSCPEEPLYRVTSDGKHIKICGGTTLNHIIAVLHRRDLLSDMISFPQRSGNDATGTRTGTGSHSQMSLHRWLKRSKTSDGTHIFTLNTTYGPYVWKVMSRYRHKVFADYDLENPVASCHLHQTLPRGRPAFILESEGEPLRDDIVVAYIVQRHRLQMETKALDLFVGPN